MILIIVHMCTSGDRFTFLGFATFVHGRRRSQLWLMLEIMDEAMREDIKDISRYGPLRLYRVFDVIGFIAAELPAAETSKVETAEPLNGLMLMQEDGEHMMIQLKLPNFFNLAECLPLKDADDESIRIAFKNLRYEVEEE
ncbi:hypothetical protein ACJX0J_024984, partial [Zea mays]